MIMAETTQKPAQEATQEPSREGIAEHTVSSTEQPTAEPAEPTAAPIEPTQPPLYASVYEEYCAKLPDIEQNHSWIYNGVGVMGGEVYYDGFYTDYQETIAGNGFRAVRFFKAYPREIMFDHVCIEGLELEQVWYSKFDETAMMDGEWIQLEAEHYYESYPNVWALSTEWLETLDPGTYSFWLYYGRELFGYYLVVHDEGEELGNYFIRACCELAFYSSELQNDVFLYFQNMHTPITEVYIGERKLTEHEYELVEDGYGIILHPEILQEFDHLIAEDVFITTENGWRGSSRIVFLNTMVPTTGEQ